jgi:hypothetical protein
VLWLPNRLRQSRTTPMSTPPRPGIAKKVISKAKFLHT